jgi:hypothetical protein
LSPPGVAAVAGAFFLMLRLFLVNFPLQHGLRRPDVRVAALS